MHSPSPSDLASLMRKWRSDHALNTAEAGEYLGLSARTVEGIEQGRGHSSARLLAIALIHMRAQKKMVDPVDAIATHSTLAMRSHESLSQYR